MFILCTVLKRKISQKKMFFSLFLRKIFAFVSRFRAIFAGTRKLANYKSKSAEAIKGTGKRDLIWQKVVSIGREISWAPAFKLRSFRLDAIFKGTVSRKITGVKSGINR